MARLPRLLRQHEPCRQSDRQDGYQHSPYPLKDFTFYGATWIDPNNLMIWLVFPTDAAHEQAKNDGVLDGMAAAVHEHLRSAGYPIGNATGVGIDFTSTEAISRNGGRSFYQ